MLPVKRPFAICGLIAVFAVGVALAIDKRPDSPGPGASSEELVAAAREAYGLKARLLDVAERRVTVDEIYFWSKRWMTAEWDLSLYSGNGARGVKEHLSRMRDLDKKIIALNKVGTAFADDVAATKYYRVEAELMFARAGGS